MLELVERMKNRLFIPHVNIFCLETRLRRVLFACETLSVNAFERVASETNERFRRDYYRNASECVLGLTCVQTRP